MFRPRVIPVLLLKNRGLVKTVGFKKPRYIGDPINAVKIFNDLKADELVFLDIQASLQNRCISPELVREIGDEAFMPFAAGGGIRTLDQVAQIIDAGAEKVVINSETISNPSLIHDAANRFGSQSIIVSLDIKKNLWGTQHAYTHSGTRKVSVTLEKYIELIEDAGAGEILINSINCDGMMNGYDIDLVKKVSEISAVPVIACGGAGKLDDLRQVVNTGWASAAAAGSLFVYHGPRKAVLVNYPERRILDELFKNDE